MICLVYIGLALLFLANWEVSLVGFVFMLLLSLTLMNQSFSYGEVMMFMSDNISSLMVALSVLLCFLALLCSSNFKDPLFVMLIQSLLIVLILAFNINSLIFFYIFFEISLIPTLMLIIGWGYQPERLQAGTYMMIYTVAASLPLLVFMIYYGMSFFSFNVFLMKCNLINIYSIWMVFAMVTAFLVKLPMYMYHLWLPKAHVEAPLAGSMILAGILLKLGGYGLLLMLKSFELELISGITIFLVMLSLWGGVLASFMCLQQSDLKAFVAYSSVAHMSLVVAGALINTSWGILGVKIIMVAHGFTSPALFFLAYISYLKSSSRSLLHSGGLLVFFPFLSLMWFLGLSVNMAAPPTLNLVGELMMMPVMWMLGWCAAGLMMVLMLFSAIYNMYLYTLSNHGGQNNLIIAGGQMKSSEYLGLLLHGFPLLLLFSLSQFSALVEFYYLMIFFWFTKPMF
uniref:NADH-ubiquinone oxidoreductase chain 4 n=1 Tax=Deroceras reticulatum TaxID=145610 RepID=A0A343ERN6_DERRE|nr:NADH dehydrogenase subunit 4 [Deroceras reticulatum]ASL05742.1 NADH dehydrogenase subunit 4 [Deroceras reticulatum]